jgi:hypothetical protein
MNEYGDYPAFPAKIHKRAPGAAEIWGSRDHPGMSLRDYFAAKAMQGLLADPSILEEEGIHEAYAASAYRFADAMLAERGKK